MANDYLSSAIKQFEYYKSLGEKAMRQLSAERLFIVPENESNSIAVIVKHLWGNMLSRWTDFLNSDGEKDWRNREAEFDNDLNTEARLWECWEQGWKTLFDALRPLVETDLERIVYIRNQGHTVVEALNRQLAHYAYHVGQIVYVARMFSGTDWQSLSIPRGGSAQFNAEKFSRPPSRAHFTDEFLDNPERDALLDYIEKIHARTRRVVKVIPEDKMDWSYKPGKFTLADLVRHIVAVERFMYAETVHGRPSIYTGSGPELADGYAAVMAFFEEKHEESMSLFRRLSDADLGRKCKTPGGTDISIRKWLRAMTEHEIHHRGQIYLYLNMLDVKTPPVFGLTAEELAAIGKHAE